MKNRLSLNGNHNLKKGSQTEAKLCAEVYGIHMRFEVPLKDP